MTTSFQTVRGAIGAARVILEPLVGHPTLPVVSKVQRVAIVDTISRAGTEFDPQDKVALVQLTLSVPFADSDSACVLEALSGQEADPRRRQQDFKAAIAYLDKRRWDKIVDSTVTSLEKEEIFFDLLKLLGLRCPTEHMLKWMASVLLLVTEPWDTLISMQLSVKKAYQSTLRSSWKQSTRGIAKPPVWILKLPCDPVQYKCAYPQIFESIYGSQLPIPPQIDEKRLKMLDDSYRCRGNGTIGALGSQQHLVPTIQTGPQFPAMGQMEQFATMMFNGMKEMQQQQTKMFELMCTAPGNSAARPRGLAALLDAESPRHATACRALENGASSPRLEFGGFPAGNRVPPFGPPLGPPATPTPLGDVPAVVERASPVQPPARAAPLGLAASVTPLGATKLGPVPLEDDDDDLPLTVVVKASRKVNAAEQASCRAFDLLDRLDDRDRARKKQDALDKAAAKTAATAAAAALAATGAGTPTGEPAPPVKGMGKGRGRGRPRLDGAGKGKGKHRRIFGKKDGKGAGY